MPEPRDAFADLERRIRQDPLDRAVNRAVNAYVCGDIDVAELELRVGDLMGIPRRRGSCRMVEATPVALSSVAGQHEPTSPPASEEAV